MAELSPETQIFGAEPQHYNDHQISLRAGKRVGLKETPPTLCDALMTPIPGEITFPINQRSLSDVFGVSDHNCLEAMALAKLEMNVELEPGGAVAMAALLTNQLPENLKEICVILSGGNVDPEIMAKAMALHQS